MLRAKDIVLRAMEPGDIDLLYKWENDEALWHLSNTVTPFSKFSLEQFIMNSHQDIFTLKQMRFMIDKNEEDPETIGTIDLFDFDPVNKKAGVGILLIQKEREKGFASQAIGLLTEYCFSILHLHQIYCNITVDNKASINLFKKHNFEVIGIKKEWLRIKNNWVDEYFMQRLNNIK